MPPALRLAFDQNFPLSLIEQIADFLPETLELASLQQIDPRLTTLDDRPLIIALSQMGWRGLITNNYRMLYQPHEVAAIVATKSVVVAVRGLGHDPLRAAGVLLLELPGLEDRLIADRANVFLLRYQRRPAQDGWEFVTQTALRRDEDPNALWRRHKPTQAELDGPVLR
jgi:hypothetical protein